jgi:hypothetical protein
MIRPRKFAQTIPIAFGPTLRGDVLLGPDLRILVARALVGSVTNLAVRISTAWPFAIDREVFERLGLAASVADLHRCRL